MLNSLLIEKHDILLNRIAVKFKSTSASTSMSKVEHTFELSCRADSWCCLNHSKMFAWYNKERAYMLCLQHSRFYLSCLHLVSFDLMYSKSLHGFNIFYGRRALKNVCKLSCDSYCKNSCMKNIHSIVFYILENICSTFHHRIEKDHTLYSACLFLGNDKYLWI